MLGASQDGSLWITIDYPEDGESISDSQIELRGKASLGSVVTIGDDILYLESSEDFTHALVLTEGANIIEIVASDSAGNEIDLFLTVYFEP